MTDAVLRDRLLATVSALDDADWLEVRRRAGAIRARRRNRRLLAIAAVLAILTALVVNPALGIGERLLDYVEGDPAPEAIKRQLANNHPPLRIGHRVIERPKAPPADFVSARLAVALDSSVGPVYLWAAPKEDGGACMALEIVALPRLPNGNPNTSGGCAPGPSEELPIVAGGGGSQVGDKSLSYVHGQVRRDIVRLEVTLSDGSVVELRIVDGFFLAELPWVDSDTRGADCGPEFTSPLSTRQQRYPRPDRCPLKAVEYRGFDTSGALVARSRVPKPPDPPKPIEPFREAISIHLFSGRKAWIEYARAERGDLCWRVRWGSQYGGSCAPVHKGSLPSMMGSGVGKNQTLLLLGPVGEEFARVELVWDDGTSERLRVEHGFVLKQIDPYGKRFPTKIVARDKTGRVVVERSAFGPG
jgi:hypothetical protein